MFELPRQLTWEAACRDAASTSPAARLDAARRLGGAAPAQAATARELLVPLVADAHPLVRAAAVTALAELDPAAAYDRLVALAREDPDPSPRQAAIAGLGLIGDPRAVPLLVELLADAQADVRFQAVVALAGFALPAAAEPLRGALADTDPGVRAAAAAALGDLGFRAAAPELAARLDDPDEAVRVEAAIALSRLDDPRGTPLLVELLRHRDYGPQAAAALFRRPDPAALPALRAVLGRWFVSPVLKVWAAAALARLGEAEGRAQLLRLLGRRQAPVRGLAIQLLGELGEPWARSALQSLQASAAGARWQEELAAALRSGPPPDAPASLP